MAKKQSSRKGRTKVKAARKTTRAATQSPSTPTPLNVLTRLIINKGNPQHPDKIISFHSGPVAWLIFNRSGAYHAVTIDPSKFSPSNPLTSNDILSVNIPDKSDGVLIATIGDAAAETSYTYDIALQNQVTELVKHIDPDLDVVDPKP